MRPAYDVQTVRAAEAPLILTIDVGSSSTRILLYDGQGRAVADVLAQERYQMRTAADGAAEGDPDAALERGARCVDAGLSQAGPLAEQIGAVAVDSTLTDPTYSLIDPSHGGNRTCDMRNGTSACRSLIWRAAISSSGFEWSKGNTPGGISSIG